MKKKIVALLSIALLISLAGCGGNSGGNDVPPSESIEATETPSETPETAPEAAESEEATYTPAESETPTEAITEPTEETSESTESPAAEQPKETPAPQTPAPTTAPTQTPAPVHTHSYVVVQSPTCTNEGIEKCSCGDTLAIPATGHNYQSQTIAATGHYEQVQVGTEQVVVSYETRKYSQCLGCGAKVYTDEEMYGHYDPESPYFSPSCAFASNLIGTESVPIYEEQPKYESVWVEDTPATTIRVCEICGHEE